MPTLQIGFVLVALCGSPLAAAEASDPYAITAEEHAACDEDVLNLCSSVDHDVNSLIDCMKAKRAQLSPACRISFTAGMKRRHFPL